MNSPTEIIKEYIAFVIERALTNGEELIDHTEWSKCTVGIFSLNSEYEIDEVTEALYNVDEYLYNLLNSAYRYITSNRVESQHLVTWGSLATYFTNDYPEYLPKDNT